MEKIGILGNGGQAKETEGYIKKSSKDIDFFAVDGDYIDSDNTRLIDIVSPQEYQKIVPVVAAIGAPALRKEMVEKWPGIEYATVISDEAYVGDSVKIEQGCVIAPRAVLTENIEIGKHCIINIGVTISHDCKLGDYVTVSPGAHVAGNVELGDGVFIGIGAIVSNNVRIEKGSVIGAGAVVINDISEENAVVVGSPGRIIKINPGWLSEV